MEPQKTPKLEDSEEAKLSRSELFARLQVEKCKVAELRGEIDAMRRQLSLVSECAAAAVDKALKDFESGVKGMKAMVYDIHRSINESSDAEAKDRTRAGNWNFTSLFDATAQNYFQPQVTATPMNTPVAHSSLLQLRKPIHTTESLRRTQPNLIDLPDEMMPSIAEEMPKTSPPEVTVAQLPDSATEETSTTEKESVKDATTAAAKASPARKAAPPRRPSYVSHNVRVAVPKVPSRSSPAMKRKVSIAAAATNGSGPKQMRTETDGQPIQPAAVTAATTTVKPAAPAARPVAGRVTIPKKPVAMASARDKMDPALAKKTDPAKRVKGAGTYKTPGQSRL